MRHTRPTAASPSTPSRKKHARQPKRGTTQPATARLTPKPTGDPGVVDTRRGAEAGGSKPVAQHRDGGRRQGGLAHAHERAPQDERREAGGGASEGGCGAPGGEAARDDPGRRHRSAAAPRTSVPRANTTTNAGPMRKPTSARVSPSSAISTGASAATSWRST